MTQLVVRMTRFITLRAPALDDASTNAPHPRVQRGPKKKLTGHRSSRTIDYAMSCEKGRLIGKWIVKARPICAWSKISMLIKVILNFCESIHTLTKLCNFLQAPSFPSNKHELEQVLRNRSFVNYRLEWIIVNCYVLYFIDITSMFSLFIPGKQAH